MLENASNNGAIYSCRADSMSQDDGSAPGVNRENVRWYVSAYLKYLVNRCAMSSANCGSTDFITVDLGSRLLPCVD